jgi:hypothetical protein
MAKTCSRGRIQRKTWDPNAGVDYNLTLCSLKSRLQYNYHEQPFARVDLNPMPRVDVIPPVRDFGFGLWTTAIVLSVVLHDHIIIR